tara:strand:- start:198 stop:1616 length:1419 start_codon:yes stop_codon:yes gene_type:complete
MTPKKIAAFAFGPLAGAALGFITLPLITWFFSQEDIGRISLLQVIVSFCTLLFTLGLDQAYVREFHETKSKPALFKTTFLPGFFLLSIVVSVLLMSGNTISLWLFEIDSRLLSVLVVVMILSTFMSRFFSLVLRMNEQGLAYSMSQILPKLLSILIIAGYVFFSASKSIDNLVFANVAAAVFVCLIYAWNTRREWLTGLKEKIDYRYLKELLEFGMPLIFGALAFWGLTATDKILLKELSDFKQLGLYSVSVSFAAAATIFQSVFSTIWAPTVYKWAAAGEGLEKIYKVNRYVLLIVIILFCLSGLFSWIVTLILPSNYNSVQWILISCLGFPLLYTLSETTVVGLGVTRRSGFSMLAAFLAFLINLVGNWWLIPTWGAIGAAVSTCVSFWFFFFLRTEFAIYVWKPMPRLALYSYTSILVFGAVINSMYGEVYSYKLIIFWLVMLSSVFIFFKQEIIEAKSWMMIRIKRKV